MDVRQTISAEQACRLAEVSRHTLFNWIAAGRVEYVRTASGAIRIYVDTLYKAGEKA